MKKALFLIITCLSATFCYAQPPQQMNYQAVVRDAAGNPLSGTAVAVRFTIHADSVNGLPVYTETISTTTNVAGLINLQIGSTQNLGGVNWGSGSKFLQVQVSNNGGAFVDMGTSQLLSVPYALFAGSTPQIIPAGMIAPFYGNPPAGWVLCDGANGTPDLRGKVLSGTDGSPGIISDMQGGTYGTKVKLTNAFNAAALSSSSWEITDTTGATIFYSSNASNLYSPDLDGIKPGWYRFKAKNSAGLGWRASSSAPYEGKFILVINKPQFGGVEIPATYFGPNDGQIPGYEMYVNFYIPPTGDQGVYAVRYYMKQ